MSAPLGEDVQLSRLIDQRVSDPRMARPNDVDAATWAEVGALARVAATLRALGEAAPPLEQDRTAAMLGLVPDPHLRLDGRALASRRKAARMSTSELASHLSRRGWDVDTASVFRWETQHTEDVPPALIAAIAKVASTTVERISSDDGSGSAPAGLEEATGQDQFKALATRFDVFAG